MSVSALSFGKHREAHDGSIPTDLKNSVLNTPQAFPLHKKS